MAPLYRVRLFEPATSADLITVTGRVFDGSLEPISDALLELWQADVAGCYAPGAAEHGAQHPGFGRVPTDADGAFRFQTVKPGRVVGPGGTLQAPHISVCLFMRGLLKPVRTRLYFPGDPSHTDDPFLALVPATRRSTLIARAGADGTLHWDVRMQGEAETVFFEF
jgi:protocatechuate 3,4-dioxygenase alpha subunit